MKGNVESMVVPQAVPPLLWASTHDVKSACSL
jgi:hypothetical protein